MSKAVITTRAAKGSALTHSQVDGNFTSLRDAANSGAISLSASGGADEDEVILTYLPTEDQTWEEDVPGARAICDVDGVIRIDVNGSSIGTITFSGGTGTFDVTGTTVQDTDAVTFVATSGLGFTQLSISIPFKL